MQEEWVILNFGLLELRVFEVERKGERGRFAGFYGAGEEVHGEKFHCCAGWWWEWGWFGILSKGNFVVRVTERDSGVFFRGRGECLTVKLA